MWLLRKRCLVQLHTYVYIVTPGFDARDGSGEGEADGLVGVGDEGAVVASATARLMRYVRTNIPADKSAYQLLERLLPCVVWMVKARLVVVPLTCVCGCMCASYFNGEYPLEEIVTLEEQRSEDLRELLSKFQRVLCICEHECNV